MPDSRPHTLDPRRLAGLIEADLEAAGLRIRLGTVGVDETLAPGTLAPQVIYDDAPVAGVRPNMRNYIAYLNQGLHQIAQYGDNPVVGSGRDRTLNAASSGIDTTAKAGTNYSHFRDAEFDRLAEGADRTADIGTLHTLLAAAEAVLARDVPYVPILSTDALRIASTAIVGYEPTAMHNELWQHVRWAERGALRQTPPP